MVCCVISEGSNDFEPKDNVILVPKACRTCDSVSLYRGLLPVSQGKFERPVPVSAPSPVDLLE